MVSSTFDAAREHLRSSILRQLGGNPLTGYVSDPSGGRPPTPIPSPDQCNPDTSHYRAQSESTVSTPFSAHFPPHELECEGGITHPEQHNYVVAASFLPTANRYTFAHVPTNVKTTMLHGLHLFAVVALLRCQLEGIGEALAMDTQARVKAFGKRIFMRAMVAWSLLQRCNVLIGGPHALEVVWRVNHKHAKKNHLPVDLFVPSDSCYEFLHLFTTSE
ncbi:hypothetical protein NM688_g6891 [Phlebia brevispora]|uniref:Uncharacterized protein n=1 Tax=Phlebia brevispora TaxID=194682 RepID=A0ACC1SBP3_9APHY|nr:hypothetical protein NM688_g6891 [Phlebia brevispora]